MLLNEIREGGLGGELVEESIESEKGVVKISRLLEWVWGIEHGLRVIQELAKVFGICELLEHHGNFQQTCMILSCPPKKPDPIFLSAEVNLQPLSIVSVRINKTRDTIK